MPVFQTMFFNCYMVFEKVLRGSWGVSPFGELPNLDFNSCCFLFFGLWGFGGPPPTPSILGQKSQ
ncbi:hypothetical protein NAAC61_03235 [Petrotoga sp. 8T1HF07.NaAc.6.1]|nr:hypothetical protein [Petrotoga sp. 8T1HF07.NaAc.6.1]